MTGISDNLNECAKEISHRYAMLKEQAIWRYFSTLPHFPAPESMSTLGIFIRHREGADEWEEFRWLDKPIFEIRILWDNYNIRVKVTDVWQKA